MNEDAELAAALLRRHPRTTGILLDFDGTIAPIVTDAATAAPLPGVLEALDTLVEQFGVVGVISARPVEFLERALDYPNRQSGLVVVGLFGLEVLDRDVLARRFPSARFATDTSFEALRPLMQSIASELRAEVSDPRMVEEKGLGVSLHWRRSPKDKDMLIALAERIAARHHLVLRRGRAVTELVPSGAPDKGTVIAEAVASCSAACYIGDDRSDLLGFDALARLRDEQNMAIVRIGVASEEMPETLRDSADVLVDGPSGTLEFLESLAR